MLQQTNKQKVDSFNETARDNVAKRMLQFNNTFKYFICYFYALESVADMRLCDNSVSSVSDIMLLQKVDVLFSSNIWQLP